jgi:hypothetical protein
MYVYSVFSCGPDVSHVPVEAFALKVDWNTHQIIYLFGRHTSTQPMPGNVGINS